MQTGELLTSSQYEKWGTSFAAVIVLNIAFRIPRIGTTSSYREREGEGETESDTR